MRVCVASEVDARDPDEGSGRLVHILHQIERSFEVIPAFPLDRRLRHAFIPARILARLRGRVYRPFREPLLLRSYARQVAWIVRKERPDLVFALGPHVLAFLRCDVPTVLCNDATFANVATTYDTFYRGTAGFLATGHLQERQSLARCTAAVYPSRWAVDSAIHDYGTDPGKLHTIAFGPNIEPPERAAVEHAIAARSTTPMRLLFAGREWHRKGGDIVLETARLLRMRGLDVTVDLAGPPGLPVPLPPYARYHGLLSRKKPAEDALLRRLFSDATLLFVPSRAEAFGLVFAEAAAFGLPVVTTAVGGLPEIVRDGTTGLLLPPEAGPEAYAAAIAGLLAEPGRYTEMSRRARQEFETRLSWDVFGTRLRDLLQGLVVDRHHAPPAAP